MMDGMDIARSDYSWPAYVLRVAGTDSRVQIAATVELSAPTISRWLNEGVRPTNSAHVAQFAKAYHRNPLEAFVAAGLLALEDASKGLADEELGLLSEVEVEESHHPPSRARTTTARR